MVQLPVVKSIGFIEKWLAIAKLLWALLTLPSIAAMLTLLLGYLQSAEMLWVIPTAAISFGATAHGVLRSGEWRFRSAIKGKLEIMGFTSVIDLTWSKVGKPIKLDRVQIGVNHVNRASYPISYRFMQLRITVENRVADAAQVEGRIFEIPAHAGSQTQPTRVEVGDLKSLEVKGKVEVEVEYGKVGNLKYTAYKKYEYSLVVHPDQGIKPNPSIGFGVNDVTENA